MTGVGIVFNFHHARDADHDDTRDFPAVWKKIKPHVVALTLTGMRDEGHFAYPLEGDSEVEIMRVIQDSGWKGSVGMTAERGGDAAETLRNSIIGIEWIAKELAQPGSGGPRPFPPLPALAPAG